jgi:nitrite reductase/ring-hydroxylating ferredoxin subunit
MPNAMIRICSTAELPGMDEVREFQLPTGRMICIANVKGRFYATDNVCPHQGAALGQGTVERGHVICPWHGYEFNPITGVAEQDAMCIVERYALKIAGDDVLADLS